MKLSHNALNFLLAQYRAIFKRAYIAGLAPAIMLTAALAAGSAQAAITPNFDTEYTTGTTSPDVVISGTDNTIAQSSTSYADDITLENGASLAVSGTASHTGILSVGSGSTLTVTGSINGNNIYTSGSGKPSNSADWTGSMQVSGGTVNVSGQMQTGEISMNSATVVIGKDGEVSAHNQGAYIIGGFGNGQNDVNAVNSSITFNEYGFLQSNDRLIVKDSTLDFNGAKHSSKQQATNEVENFETAFIRGRDGVELYNTKLKVADSKKGGIYGPTTTVSGGSLTIGTSSEFVFDGDWNGFKDPTNDSETYSHAAGQLTLSEVAIVNKGSLTIGGADHLTDLTLTGGSMQNTGTVSIYADSLNLTESYFNGLFSDGSSDSAQGKLTFGGNDINVDGTVDLNELGIIGADGALTDNFVIEGEQTVTLAASTINLDSAYKAGNLSLDAGILNFSGAATNKRFTISSGSITVHDVLNGAAETDRVVIKAESEGDSATLHLAAGASGGVITNVDRINVGWSSKANGTSKLEVDGTWDFGDARITASSNAQVTIDGTANNVSDLMMESTGHVTVNGAMTIERLLGAEKGTTGTIDLNGSLTITGDGDLTDEGSNVNNIYFNDVQLPLATVNINNGGTLAITGEDALEDIFSVTKDADGKVTNISVVASGSKTEAHGGWDKTKVNLKAGGTLSLDLSQVGVTTLTTAELASLKNSLVSDATKGAFNFGSGLTIEVDPKLQADINNGEVSYSDLANAGINNVQGVNGVDSKVTVTVDDTTNGNGINLGNNAAAVKLTGSNTALNVSGSLILTNNGGNFVYSEDATTGQQTVKGVTVNSASAVNLTGSGTVGDITEAASATGTSAKLTGTGSGLNVQGTISLDTVDIGTGTVNTTGAVTAKEKLNVDGILNVAQGSGDVTIGTSGATIAGGLNAGTITSSGKMDVTGAIVATKLVLGDTNTGGKNLTVGDASSSARIVLESLNLNGGMLLIDPDWNQNAAIVNITGSTTADVIDVNGSIGVGRNSVGVFGTTAAEAETSLARLGLLNGGKLDQNGIGAALYLGDTLAVADQKHVLVDKTQDNNGLSTAISALSSSGSVTLESGSALGFVKQ